MSIYAPNNYTDGTESVYAQHKQYLQAHNDDRTPLQSFWQDFEDEL